MPFAGFTYASAESRQTPDPTAALMSSQEMAVVSGLETITNGGRHDLN